MEIEDTEVVLGCRLDKAVVPLGFKGVGFVLQSWGLYLLRRLLEHFPNDFVLLEAFFNLVMDFELLGLLLELEVELLLALKGVVSLDGVGAGDHCLVTVEDPNLGA